MNRFLGLQFDKTNGFEEKEFNNLLEIGSLSDDEIAVAFLLSPYEVLAVEGISVPKNLMLHFLSKTTLDKKCVEIFKRADVSNFLEEALEVFCIHYQENYVKNAYHKHEYINDEAAEVLCDAIISLLKAGIEIPEVEALVGKYLFPDDRAKLKKFLNNQ